MHKEIIIYLVTVEYNHTLVYKKAFLNESLAIMTRDSMSLTESEDNLTVVHLSSLTLNLDNE